MKLAVIATIREKKSFLCGDSENSLDEQNLTKKNIH